MSKAQLNQIIRYTPIDEPISLKWWHHMICTSFGLLGLYLYYTNLPEPTIENILTDYLGVLSANFTSIFFAGRDYFKDKQEREIPEELKDILVPESHRTALVVSGSLAAALPYAGMAWEASPIDDFSSATTNAILTAVTAIITGLVNAFMNNIPVREVLENTRLRWLLFFLPLILYYGGKQLLDLCLCKTKRKKDVLLPELPRELKVNISRRIDLALNHVTLLDDSQLLALERAIREKNRGSIETDKDDYFDYIINTALPPLQLSINSVGLIRPEEEKASSPCCVQSRTGCVRVLDHDIFKKVILLCGIFFAAVILLADSQYVQDSSEDIAGDIGIGNIGRKIFGWCMVYLAMSFAFVLNRDFCTGTLQYISDSVGGVVNPAQTKNFGSRFYPRSKMALTAVGGYLGGNSAAAGVKLYSEKVPNSALIFFTKLGIPLFNTCALFKLPEDILKSYASSYGRPSAKAAANIISFFNLLKKRVNMLDEQKSSSRFTYDM